MSTIIKRGCFNLFQTALPGENPVDFPRKKMVEAAGVEPASLPNKPAATTCLVRRESQPPDNDLTRIRRSSPHENFSAKRAQTPRFT
jgi:hypothetical protein